MSAQPTLRYSVETSDNLLKIIIPSRKSWWRILLLSLYVLFAIWVVIGLLAFLIGEANVSLYSVGYLAFFVSLILRGGCILMGIVTIAIALLPLLWQAFGKEIIEINNTSITTHRHILGVGPHQVFQANRIKNMYVSPAKDFLSEFRLLHYHRNPPWSPKYQTYAGGSIAIEYGTFSLKRFGVGLDANEAKQLLNLIHQRFSEYHIQE